MSEPPIPPPARHHLLEQAPVPPLDVDGLQAVTIGTIAFAIATVLTTVFYDSLRASGDGWWLGVCISGFLLGLVGLAYCWRRRRRRRA